MGDDAITFELHRGELLALAYRMLGELARWGRGRRAGSLDSLARRGAPGDVALAE